MQTVEDKPVACTLDAGALQSRLADIRALTSGLVSHAVCGQTLRLGYRPDSLDEVRRIVSLERQCCSFLDFAIEGVNGDVVLTISAPDQNDGAAHWLFAQFLPGAAVAPKGCGCVGACS